MRAVVAYVSTINGSADAVGLQALALARRVASGGAVHALVIGDEGAAAMLGAWGASDVRVAQHPGLATTAPDAIGRILADLATSVGASAIVGPGTEAGNTVIARAAVRAGAPFAANCTTAAAGSDGELTVTRLRWGGSLLEDAVLHGDMVALTAAPHAIAAEETGGTASVTTFTPELDDRDLAVRVVERIPSAAGGVSLADAKVVVSGGRGAGSAAGFAVIEELAALLGAAVGCTRAVTIAGWRPHTEQVGQTGTKIAPNLYIAAGISGATQHLAGARGAKKLIAINKDGESPIMAAADYAVIGDMHEIVPAISAEIRRRRAAT
jgi:electron transfer flavoprotein alpha subunit